ncbi:methylated-DNA--[protein]-cysteine S-methyltransferase [Paramicrobacterium fandaimingii]|uniref:methylated-DNA--[protein]-cysteine S-methyltransferase n=1 Tax=Paramicrobacterium fandaimingii TaxID=2708079 RepID=UPI001421F788|nr:methylated-DNA--[protein]-cysteine S-methyltransferase [Microbacterium fandaimingii]
MTTAHSVIDTPIGDLTVVGHRAATGAQADARAQIAKAPVVLTAVWMTVERHQQPADELGERDDATFAGVAQQFDEYFAGTRTRFDVALDPAGTAFEKQVWLLLRDIPYGTTRSYGDLAADLGDPNLSRAVGTANGRNPLSIIVPCHRVIGADGSLTGYAGGLERKRFLLALERDTTPTADQLF